MTTRTEHVPVDFALYLPMLWTDDAARRREARIPADVSFKTKPELALDMIGRAVAALGSRAPKAIEDQER